MSMYRQDEYEKRHRQENEEPEKAGDEQRIVDDDSPLHEELPDPAPVEDVEQRQKEKEEREERADDSEEVKPTPAINLGLATSTGMEGHMYPPAADISPEDLAENDEESESKDDNRK